MLALLKRVEETLIFFMKNQEEEKLDALRASREAATGKKEKQKKTESIRTCGGGRRRGVKLSKSMDDYSFGHRLGYSSILNELLSLKEYGSALSTKLN